MRSQPCISCKHATLLAFAALKRDALRAVHLRASSMSCIVWMYSILNCSDLIESALNIRIKASRRAEAVPQLWKHSP